MAIPSFTMRQLLEAGVHFGHHTRRWNPAWSHLFLASATVFIFLTPQQTVPCWRAPLKQCVKRLPKVVGFYLWVQSASLQIKLQKPPAIVASIM